MKNWIFLNIGKDVLFSQKQFLEKSAPKAVPNVGKAQYDFLFGKNFQNGIFFGKFSI